MKNSFLILLILNLLIPFNSWSEDLLKLVKRNGIYYKKFSDIPFNGKVSGRYNGDFKNGLEHGQWVGYHHNGQLLYKGKFNNGKREGEWIFYFDTGVLDSKGVYKNGKKEGIWIENLYNGTKDKKKSGIYVNGKKVSN